MKKLGILILSVTLLSFVGSKNVGKQLPSVQLKNLSNKVVNSTTITKGKPVIISFWSTTCIPCIKELSAINEKYDAWKKETGLEVIAISTDDPRFSAKVPLIAQKKGWKFPVVKDDTKSFFKQLSIKANPYTIVVDKTGKIVYEHASYKPGDEEQLIQKIRSLK